MSGGDRYYRRLYSINMYPLFQEETDTIADYIVMYQHQRKQQKMKIQVFFYSKKFVVRFWRPLEGFHFHWRG